MNKNKKEYLKPGVKIVPLRSKVNMLTSTIYTRDANNPLAPQDDEEIINSDEIL